MATGPRVPPVFIFDSDLSIDGNRVNGLHLCRALTKFLGDSSVEGAQKIGVLWRVYLTSPQFRAALLSAGLDFEGRHVDFLNLNPFQVRDQSSPVVKLLIGGIPLSGDTETIRTSLTAFGLELRSNINFEKYRDEDGGLTPFKTGRRFVYIATPNFAIPAKKDIGQWKASLYHKGQVRPTNTNTTHSNQQLTHHSHSYASVTQLSTALSDGEKEEEEVGGEHGDCSHVEQENGENRGKEGKGRREDINWFDMGQEKKTRQPLMSQSVFLGVKSRSPSLKRGRQRTISGANRDKRQRSMSQARRSSVSPPPSQSQVSPLSVGDNHTNKS